MCVHARVSARTHSMGKKGACWEGGNQPEDRDSSGVVLDSLLLLSVSSLYSAVHHGGEIKAAGAQSSGSQTSIVRNRGECKLARSLCSPFYTVQVLNTVKSESG